MREPLLFLAPLLAAVGVTLGAFGAHGLEARLGDSLATWQTAVSYHLLHALAALAVASLLRVGVELPGLRLAGWLFVAGVFAFSGSLYGLALGGPRFLGPITPLGGLLFIAGWMLLAAAALRDESVT